MYKSPIELFITDIQYQVTEKMEEACYEAVLHYIPNVDRAELMRALKYDRQQYEAGYRDAVRAKDLVEVVRCKDCRFKTEPGQPNILCYNMKDDDFCSYGERRTENE